MAIEFSPALRDALLDQIEATVWASPTMLIATGSPPATLGTADSGTTLATLTLPSDWMAAASGGVKSKTGTWTDASADASGSPGFGRIKSSGGTAHIQWTCAVTSGGDMNFDAAVSLGGTITVTQFDLTAGNADS